MSLSSVSPLICQDSLMLLFMSCIDGLVSQTHLDSSQLMHRSFPWCRASKNRSSMGTSKVWPKKQHLFQQSLSSLTKKTDKNKKKNGCLSIFLASHTLQIGDVWVQGFHSIMHNNSIRSPQLVYLTFLYFTRSTSFSMPACVMSSAKPYFLASSAPFRIQNCSPRSAGSSTGVGKTNWSFPWWSPSPRQLQVAKSTHISPNVYLGKSYVLQPAKDAKWNSYRKGDPWSVRFSVSVHSGYLPAFRKQTYLVGKSIYFLCPNRKHIYTFMVNVPANCVERPLHSWGP